MENNSPRAQSAHCSSHLHYAALQPRARFATARPARARAHAHTDTRILPPTHPRLPGRGRGWVRSAGTGRGRCGRGRGVLLVYLGLGFLMFSLPCLLPGTFPFLCLPGPAPSAPQGLELPRRSGDSGSGEGRSQPLSPADRSPRRAALAVSAEDTCSGGTGDASRLPGRGSRSAPIPGSPGLPLARSGSCGIPRRTAGSAGWSSPTGTARPSLPSARRCLDPLLLPLWLSRH